MQKKWVKVILCVACLAVLIAAYIVIDDKSESDGEDTEQSESLESVSKYPLLDFQSENVDYIKFLTDDAVLEILPDTENDGQWIIKGYEGVLLNQSNVQSIVSSMATLGAEEKVENSSADLKEYGLDNPSANMLIRLKDGTEKNIYIGTSTPDNAYYYAMSDGDSNIYMIDQLKGKRFYYTINDFIDKSLPQISQYAITYIDVKQKDKEELEIEYIKDKEGNASELQMMGMETLKMHKPIEGAVVYPSNLQENVLTNIADFTIDELIDAFPKDLSKYGLQEPVATITLKDSNNSLSLKIGSRYDDARVYCMIDDRPHVFIMKDSGITPLLEADIYKFIERFVAMHYRTDVKSVNMQYQNQKYDITFGEPVETDEEVDESKKRFNDTRPAYLNGKELDKENFASLYELVVGITFDNIEPNANPNGAPEVTIAYTLNDDSVDEVKFYNYNETFYLAENNGIKGRLVNKQTVLKMLKTAEEMSK